MQNWKKFGVAFGKKWNIFPCGRAPPPYTKFYFISGGVRYTTVYFLIPHFSMYLIIYQGLKPKLYFCISNKVYYLARQRVKGFLVCRDRYRNKENISDNWTYFTFLYIRCQTMKRQYFQIAIFSPGIALGKFCSPTLEQEIIITGR